MPSRRELSGMPGRVAMAYRMIAGASRVMTMRYVLDNPGASVAEIADATGVSLASARVSLADLEEAGYVVADVEGPRNGRIVRYSADRRQFVDDLGLLWAWMAR
ncbi:winged helix-turn-helix domain-containing protein [Cnuibacter physcomitrellae]|uniref:winged helix-turn-helix domain-containing protein n=1 Tax=Cnuibacter physcomitrellae TaxID=1619308 RepID=UPI002175DBD8|nr:winged helix-turn-helix domain-containing protein [Cnuibacter physcomitrellae]MCS5498212.1 winged helix-turn-helix domain-containing protein [Cnuibacter physcomitrellae]